MWTVSLWFFLFLFAINGFALFLDDAFTEYSIINPFTNSTISFPTQPTPYTTFQTLNDTTATNATGGPIVGIWDAANYGWNATIFLYNLITGGFVFQVIAAIVPATGSTVLIYGIIQGVIAFFLILTLIHFLRAIF